AKSGRLGRLAAVADRPGLPRALARTLRELRLAGGRAGGELDDALAIYAKELAEAKLADRALAVTLAIETARSAARHPLLDVPLHAAAEAELGAAVAARAPDVLVTVPEGDERSLRRWGAATPLLPDGSTALGRLQARLFASSDGGAAEFAPCGDDVVLLS